MKRIKISDIPEMERPVEKLITYGAETLSNSELLSIILRCGVKGENVINLSQRILCDLEGLSGLLDVSYSDLISIKGIKKVKGAQLLALVEIVKRINNAKSSKMQKTIDSPKVLEDMLINEMSVLKQEVLKLIILDTKNKIIKIKDIFRGTLNSSIVHPREIFSEAVKFCGANIIICHNHPSGDCTPSQEDINITLRIKECGKFMGINLLDHIIVGKNNIISLKEKGII